jgi:hypothetical protein
VNVAARLEGLAEPGDICVARNVYDQVKTKLDLAFEPMGEHAEELLRTGLTEAPNREMHEYYRKAIEKDPDFALAHMGLGWVEMRAYWGGWSSDPDETLQRALDYGLKALALDEKQAMVHVLLGDVYVSMGQLDRGVAEHAKARALNRNDPDIKSEAAAYLAYAGRVDEAIALMSGCG